MGHRDQQSRRRGTGHSVPAKQAAELTEIGAISRDELVQQLCLIAEAAFSFGFHGEAFV
jgi:hypothetical protein